MKLRSKVVGVLLMGSLFLSKYYNTNIISNINFKLSIIILV